MLRYAVAAAFLVSTMTPALAAEWYIAKNKAENKCDVTETKPDGEKLVMVGTATYATKEEAKKARNAMSEECPWKKKEDKDKDNKEG